MGSTKDDVPYASRRRDSYLIPALLSSTVQQSGLPTDATISLSSAFRRHEAENVLGREAGNSISENPIGTARYIVEGRAEKGVGGNTVAAGAGTGLSLAGDFCSSLVLAFLPSCDGFLTGLRERR